MLPRNRLITNARDRHHSPSLSFLRAIGEEQLGVAVGAQWRTLNIFRTQSRCHQLLPVGLDQVQKEFRRQFAVPWGSGTEKQQGILLAHRIGLLHLPEQASRITELRFKLCADFFADLVAAAMNPRTDRRFKILRAAAEAAHHFPYALFDNALYGAPPACMEHSDSPEPRVDDDDGQAIRCLNREQQTGSGSYHPIAWQLFAGHAFDVANDVGMNLPQRDEWPRRSGLVSRLRDSTKLFQKGCAVSFHRSARIVLGESEIQATFTVNSREAAASGGKAVNEPGDRAELAGLKNLQVGFLALFWSSPG